MLRRRCFCASRVVFDEGAARFDFVAHQGNEHFVGGDGVFDADFQEDGGR